MLYRTYGATGCEVSVLGFGGMRFRDIDDEAACVNLVHRAYEAGVNYFDTAVGYFGGKSEERFGQAFVEMLPQRAQTPFYVATKSMARTPEDLRRDLETSLGRLGVDAIDFYHYWCVVSFEDFEERRRNGVLDEFLKIKEEGLARHIVVSSHLRGDQIGTLLADYPFEGVLLGYSAMNFHYREAALEAAARLGRGVVAMNPLGGGLIPQHAERFAFLRTREEETVVQAAIRFLVNDPRLTCALVGFADTEELAEAVAAVEDFRPLSAEAVERMRGELGTHLDEICTACGYCDDCPVGVPVPKLMHAYNSYLLRDDPKAAFLEMKYHWGIDREGHGLDDCTACGLCEKRCTQRLPILERMDALRGILREYGE